MKTRGARFDYRGLNDPHSELEDEDSDDEDQDNIPQTVTATGDEFHNVTEARESPAPSPVSRLWWCRR